MQINLKVAHADLCQRLLDDLYTANDLGGYFARDAGEVFGAIHTALVATLAYAIAGAHAPIFFADAYDIARLLVEEEMRNGERSIQYQISLWNSGVISR